MGKPGSHGGSIDENSCSKECKVPGRYTLYLLHNPKERNAVSRLQNPIRKLLKVRRPFFRRPSLGLKRSFSFAIPDTNARRRQLLMLARRF